MPTAVQVALAAAGVAVVDVRVLGDDNAASATVQAFAHPPTTRGVLAAIFSLTPTRTETNPEGLELQLGLPVEVDDATAGELVRRFEAVDAAGREALRAFVRDPVNLDTGRIPSELVPHLQALPIYPVYGHGREGEGEGGGVGVGGRLGAESTAVYHTLRTQHWLPPESYDTELLDASFVMVRDGRDVQLLEALGVTRMPPATLYLDHVLPRLTVGGGSGGRARRGSGGSAGLARRGSLPEGLGRATSLRLLEEFQTLVRQNPALLDVARDTAFVPNAEG